MREEKGKRKKLLQYGREKWSNAGIIPVLIFFPIPEATSGQWRGREARFTVPCDANGTKGLLENSVCLFHFVGLFIYFPFFFLANQERKENEEKITKDNTIHERERESKIQQKSRYRKKNECKIQQDTKNKTRESVYNIWREKTDFKSQNRKQRNSTV